MDSRVKPRTNGLRSEPQSTRTSAKSRISQHISHQASPAAKSDSPEINYSRKGPEHAAGPESGDKDRIHDVPEVRVQIHGLNAGGWIGDEVRQIHRSFKRCFLS